MVTSKKLKELSIEINNQFTKVSSKFLSSSEEANMRHFHTYCYFLRFQWMRASGILIKNEWQLKYENYIKVERMKWKF